MSQRKMSETSIIKDHDPTKRTQFAPWQAFNNTSAQLDIIDLRSELHTFFGHLH